MIESVALSEISYGYMKLPKEWDTVSKEVIKEDWDVTDEKFSLRERAPTLYIGWLAIAENGEVPGEKFKENYEKTTYYEEGVILDEMFLEGSYE